MFYMTSKRPHKGGGGRRRLVVNNAAHATANLDAVVARPVVHDLKGVVNLGRALRIVRQNRHNLLKQVPAHSRRGGGEEEGG